MALERVNIPLLNGGIRNDVISQLINLNEAWDALNEDSTILEGASSKRRGRNTITTFDYPIRCIFEGEMWSRKRIVVAGGLVYEFTPPSTFTELYSEFDGESYDIVHVVPFRDRVLGRIFIFCDGVNHPMYWDGVNPPVELPNNAPIARCGVWHKTFFIFGNLREGERGLLDSGDNIIDLSSTTITYNTAEVSLGTPCGGDIVSIMVETTCAAYYICIFDEEPKTYSASRATPELRNTTNQVYFSGAKNGSYIANTIGTEFYSKYGKLYITAAKTVGSTDTTITVRLLIKRNPLSGEFSSDIKWCDSGNINEWTVSTTTLSGRLSVETSGGGDIIAMLPLDVDTFIIYKDDGSIISCYTTGSASLVFGYKTISEGYKLMSGNAIVAAEGSHYALSNQGFIKVGASSAELVEPFGKAKGLFKGITDDWQNCVATFDPTNRRIIIAYPRTGSHVNDGVMVFNIKDGTYDVWDGSYTAVCHISNASITTIADLAGMKVADFTSYTVDDPRLRRIETQLYAGSSDGVLYNFPLWKIADGNTAISSYRETGFIRPDPMYDGQCWFRAIALEIDLLGDYDIILEYRSDYDKDWKTVPVVNTSKGVTDKQTKVIKRYINTTGRAIKVKWSNATANNTYIIRSMYIDYEKMEEKDA